MSNKIKPKILKGQFVFTGSKLSGKEHEWLCIPLTPASRKAMINAMRQGIAEERHNNDEYALLDLAKAALSALEAMAKTP